MIPLRVRGIAAGDWNSIVGRVTFSKEKPGEVLVVRAEDGLQGDLPLASQLPREIAAVVVEGECDQPDDRFSTPFIQNVANTAHLTEGDIVGVHNSGLIETLFRVSSEDNALFITDRCNSNCLMCSQPPRDVDDLAALFELNTRLIPLIPKETGLVGITGGEPTILGRRLVTLLSQLKHELPHTAVHMLSNGRAFAWRKVAEAVASVAHPDLTFGIPLYSDYGPDHNYVVQAKNAFEQTVIGLQNLARYNQRIEIRVVLHRQTVGRLPQLADYIYRHLPFAEHVAFMGLEYVGYTPHNKDLLWIEPEEYAAPLRDAVSLLNTMGMNVSIYNLPLCLLPEGLWPFCKISISDWKREYVDECTQCTVKESCGGVFGTSKRLSARIRAVTS